MKELRDLRRFVLAKSAEGSHAEVRSHIVENVHSLARAFRVSVDTLTNAVESEKDDGVLCSKLLETLRRSEAVLRDAHRSSRLHTAQASANVLASAVTWKDDKAYIDIPSVFASTLTRRDDLLVFTCEAFTVAVYQAPLLDLAKIARVRKDVSGWVDRDGLHLRWGHAGAINLRPQQDPEAAKVVVTLPKAAAIAA
jgi:hypothetical protein